MAVERYRDVADMPPPPRTTGPELGQCIREVMMRAVRLAGAGYPPGVHRFATLDDAQEARGQVVRARAQRRRGG